MTPIDKAKKLFDKAIELAKQGEYSLAYDLGAEGQRIFLDLGYASRQELIRTLSDNGT